MIFNVDFSESSQVVGELGGNNNNVSPEVAIKEHNADKTAHAELFKDYAKPADIAQAVNAAVAVSEGKAQSLYANAVKGSESGEVIRVDNVSPVEHRVIAKISGKNLLNVSGLINAAFVKNEDESYSFTKNGSARFTNLVDIEIPENTIITVSAAEIEGTADGFALQTLNADGSYTSLVSLSPAKPYASAKVTNKPEKIRLYLGSGEVDGAYLKISDLQIEIGSTATDYEPYIDPASVTVTRSGKNIMPYPYSETSRTRNGVTFTVNADGTILASGTSSGAYLMLLKAADKKLFLHKGKKYKFSCTSAGGAVDTYYAYITTADGITHFDYGEGVTIIPTESGYVSCNVVVKDGATVTNLLFSPQLEKGEVTTSREAYNGETYTPNADGLCDITSLAPTMTLCTDTAGAIIDLEYNKDINKALNNRVKISNGDTITLADNVTYYAESEISTLTVIYPAGNFISALEFKLASAGNITITLPQSKYIGGAPTFANGETWELNIKNGIVVGGLVE